MTHFPFGRRLQEGAGLRTFLAPTLKEIADNLVTWFATYVAELEAAARTR